MFRDIRFRQAWSHFVPRQKLNDILYAGQAPLKVQGIIKEGPSSGSCRKR